MLKHYYLATLLPVFRLIEEKDWFLLKKWIERNDKEIHIPDKYNETALSKLAEMGKIELVKMLIQVGADINTRCANHGRYPLFVAAMYGHLEVVKVLIQAGAKVDQCDNYGYSPLSFAAFNGHLNVVKVLIQSTANPNVGQPPLWSAAFSGHLKIVKLLLQAGADPNQCDRLGRSPLDIATERGHLDVVEVLKGWRQMVPLRILCLRIIHTHSQAVKVPEWDDDIL